MSKALWIQENQRAGEKYAGILLGKGDEPDHHLFLILPKASKVNWDQAMEFAKKVGDGLPTRREQSLLIANLKEEFDGRYHWSCEQHAAGPGYAWLQDFDFGGQNYLRKTFEAEAVAVRRLVIF